MREYRLMSAPTVAAEPLRKKRLFFFRALFAFSLVVLLAFFSLAAWIYWITHSPLPQLDGNVRIAGLQHSVEVIRDHQGVPHVRAANMHDLLFAQGYITAQDRLWQMDTTRRFAAGEMAEVLGPEWIKHDRQQRILGLHQIAQRSTGSLSPQDLPLYQAYSDGINAFIFTHRNGLPGEFRLLGYQPRPWTIEDSFMIGANMVQTLSLDSFSHKIAHEKIIAALGPAMAADLYPNSSWRDRLPVPDSAPHAAAGHYQSEDLRPSFWGSGLPALPIANFAYARPGSNNWVISGAHTVTGKPLLANDMHLDLQIPDVWYEAQLELADGSFDAAGVTLPGLPYIIVGHNRRIAWGFTNLGPDVDDLYVENFNAAGEYQTPRGWRKPEVRREIIHVKGATDVSIDVVSTRHGPIITSFLPGETRKIAVKWILAETGLSSPFRAINSAGNWQEFRTALSQLSTPSQNVVYADVDGNTGYQATGKIPIRASGDGALPVSGAGDAHEWTGYIPFDQLPNSYNPSSGILATANGRIAPLGYPYSISSEWGAPYRTERIYHVLESGKKFSTSDMLALQTDVYSAFDMVCAEKFVAAVDRTPGASARAHQAADIMRHWDGQMKKDSAAAAITLRARAEFLEMLLAAKLGPLGKRYEWYSSAVATENLITKESPEWLPAQYKNYDEFLTAAVERAIGIDARNLASFKLGDQYPLLIEHPVLAHVPILRRWAGPGRVAIDGDGETVKQAGAHGLGPSERFTANLADWDQSTLNVVTGESGEPFSPYYMDQWSAWYHGTTFKLPFSEAAVEQAAEHRLQLLPTQ